MHVASKSKQEVVTEFRCTEILRAGRKVFAKKGFDQATVDDIAAAAGVAKGTLYIYFPSKREIYLAAIKQDVLALHAETDRRIRSCETAAAKIRAFIGTRVEYCERNRDFFRIYYSEFANFFVPLAHAPKGLRELYLRQAKKLEAMLQQAVERGEIRKIRPRAVALRLYDMTLGLIAERLLGWSKASVDRDIDSLFDLLWRGIETRNRNKGKSHGHSKRKK
jgi:AcrR family transcriptional regulator